MKEVRMAEETPDLLAALRASLQHPPTAEEILSVGDEQDAADRLSDNDELLVQENHISVDPDTYFGRMGITLEYGDGCASMMTPEAADELGRALVIAAKAFNAGIEIRQ